MYVLIFLDGYFVWGLVDMRKSFAAHGDRPDSSHIPVFAVIFLQTLRYIHHRLKNGENPSEIFRVLVIEYSCQPALQRSSQVSTTCFA